ncbi:hypothetical protein LINGRAPRIM_LOCUS1312, partial [Linum grandiflorum]
ECEIGEEGYVVKLDTRSCSCGYWDLSGIPCLHAVAAISYMRNDVYQYINEYYSIENARKAYEHGVPALRGQQAWVVAQGSVIMPPAFRPMPGRPRKQRIREVQELESIPSRSGVGTTVGRKGIVMHCSRCQQHGHNSRKCQMTAREAEVCLIIDCLFSLCEYSN